MKLAEEKEKCIKRIIFKYFYWPSRNNISGCDKFTSRSVASLQTQVVESSTMVNSLERVKRGFGANETKHRVW